MSDFYSPPDASREFQATRKKPLEQRFAEQWQRSKRDGQPAAIFSGYYAKHFRPENLAEMQPKFELADIYVPEAVGYADWQASRFQELSDGKMPFDHALVYAGISSSDPGYEHREAEMKLLYNSHKPVMLLDTPETWQYFTEMNMFAQAMRLPAVFEHYELFGGPTGKKRTFAEALQYINHVMRVFARNQNRREDYMVELVPYALTEILKTHPQLAEKPELNVLFRLGTMHDSRVAERADDPDLDLLFRDRLVASFMQGNEPTELQTGYVLMERLIYPGPHYAMLQKVFRQNGVTEEPDFEKLIRSLSLQQMGQFFNTASQDLERFAQELCDLYLIQHPKKQS